MKDKIIIVIPYFGKLPNWFQTFLLSAEKTKIVDFLLITDDKRNFDYPSNFEVVYKEFKEIQDLFYNKIGKVYLEHPYKLCEYRPCYGFVFQEFIEGYSFWGHSDIDVIYGDIDKYLNEINYLQYEKIFNLGHFTIYKNELKINTLFKNKFKNNFPKICDFDFVKQTTYACHFDELGINFISKRSGIKFYDSKFCKNVNMNYNNYAVDGGKPKDPELLIYDNGKLYIKRKNSSEEEFMYLHIQKRKITSNLIPSTKKFIITKDGFIDINDDYDLYFKKYGLNDDAHLQNEHRANLLLNLKKEKKNRIIRELSTKPFRFVYNMWQRKKSVDFLKKNNLF